MIEPANRLPSLLFGESTAVAHVDGLALSQWISTNLGMSLAFNELHTVGSVEHRSAVARFEHIDLLALSAARIVVTSSDSLCGLLFIPIAGRCIASSEGSSFELVAGRHACILPRGAWMVKSDRPLSALIIRLHTRALSQIAQSMNVLTKLQSLRDQKLVLCKMQIDGLHLSELINGIGGLVDVLSNSPRALVHSGLEACVSRFAAMLLQPQAYTSKMRQDAEKNLKESSKLGQICEFIDANLGRRITMADLESIGDLSARTIQYHFQHNFSCTPKRWILKRRLERARALFLQGVPKTVTEVVTEMQFSNLGHFAKMYQDEFGELPSATLKLAIEKNRSK